jgi:hypothetical protein
VDQYGNQLLRLHNVLQSVKNADTKPTRTKVPMPYVLLANMLSYLENGVAYLALQTACVVAFFGFLRRNEFTSRANFDSNILGHIYVLDVIMLYPMTVQLFLKTSKIDKQYILNCLRLIAIDALTNVYGN